MNYTRKFHLCLIFIFLFWGNNSRGQKVTFKVYNAMMFRNMPDLSKNGLSKITMIYDDSLLTKSVSHPNVLNERTFNYSKFLREKDKLVNKSHIPICLDIESWNLMDPYFNMSIKKYQNVLNYFRSSTNSIKIGYYGVFPYADAYLYEAFKGNKAKSFMNDWRTVNRKISAIIPSVDIIYPSCYTRSKNIDIWKKAFLMQYEQIRKVTKKPIYAFIWPQYYNKYDKSINNKFIDYDSWLFELETLYKYCDGIVLWSPPFDLTTRRPLFWNSHLDWWRATQYFIKKHNIRAN